MKSKVLLSMLLSAMFFGACKKDNSLDVQMPEASIVTKSAAEQVKYAEVNLKKIANTVGKLTQNPEFVNFVHTEVAKKRDGQFEVLITRLLKSPVWGPQLNTKELNEGLAAFKNLQGTDYYPQIYIPKMQNDEDNHSTNFTATNNTTASDDVKVVVFGGELAGVPEDAPHPSYNVNEAGVLTPFQDIAEPYANEHEVWVFSINEVITTNGLMQAPTDGDCGPNNSNYPECTYGGGGGSGGGGGGGSTNSDDTDPSEFARNPHPNMGTNSPINVKISKMKVQEHKESWLSGGSEICMRAVLNTINGKALGNINDPNVNGTQYVATTIGKTNYLGRLVRLFSRSEIKNKENVTMDFPLQTDWPTSSPLTDPIYFDYVIFERDNWPAEKNYYYRQDYSGAPFYIQDTYPQFYRSEQSAYFSSSLTTSTYYAPNSPFNIYSKSARYYNQGGAAAYLSLSFETVSY